MKNEWPEVSHIRFCVMPCLEGYPIFILNSNFNWTSCTLWWWYCWWKEIKIGRQSGLVFSHSFNAMKFQKLIKTFKKYITLNSYQILNRQLALHIIIIFFGGWLNTCGYFPADYQKSFMKCNICTWICSCREITTVNNNPKYCRYATRVD